MKTAESGISPAPPVLHLWRISSHVSLDGIGAFRFGGRWNSPGLHVVYLAESPASAMLETIVHLSVDKLDLPDSYKLLRIGVPLRFPVATLDVPNGASWTKDAAITRQIGNEWLEQNGAALARVPSVIVPYTWNYLLNPRHSDSVRCEVTQVSEHLHDPRLLRIRDL